MKYLLEPSNYHVLKIEFHRFFFGGSLSSSSISFLINSPLHSHVFPTLSFYRGFTNLLIIAYQLKYVEKVHLQIFDLNINLIQLIFSFL